jgi:peptide subunit release factor 1 (eRF1)
MVYHKESGSIEVSELLLAEAFDAIASKEYAHNGDTIDVPPAMIEGVIEYLSEDLGCDHAVNICTCGTQGLVYELKLALEGKMTCKLCSGDGQTWSKTRYAREIKRVAKEQGVPVAQIECDGEGFGYETCKACNGSGAVLR